MQVRFFFIWFFSLVLMGNVSYAQKLLPVRLEIPGDIDVESYHTELLGEQGVLVYYQTNETDEKGNVLWDFALLDNKLKQKWIKSLPLGRTLLLSSVTSDDGKVYFLFKNHEKVSRDYDIYEIVIFNKKKEHFTNVSGSIPYKSDIAGFKVIMNTACIGLKLKNQNADLAFVDLVSGAIQPVHLDMENSALIETMHVDRKTKQFYIVAKYYNSVTFFKDIIYLFDRSGKELDKLAVEYPDNKKLPRNYRFASISKNSLTLLGTYDLITAKRPSWNSVSEYENSDDETLTAGIFYLNFINGKQKKLLFYDFTKFDNTYYSSHGKEVHVYKGKSDNSRLVKVFYKIGVPEIVTLGNETVLYVELFKPVYKTETRMDYDFYGRQYPVTYQVFDGYEYYDVIFAGISSDGTLLWNNDFSIDNLKSHSLDDHVIAVADKQLLTMAYVDNGKIVSQTFDKNRDLSEKESVSLETLYAKDRIIQDENSTLKYWYGDYYLVSGYQKLKNRTLDDKSNRTVFFINKIAFK